MYIVYKTKKKIKSTSLGDQVKYIDHFEIVEEKEKVIERFKEFIKKKSTYTCGWAKIKDDY
jgi:hypothetical protein